MRKFIEAFMAITSKPLFQLALLSYECAAYGASVAQQLWGYAAIHALCAMVWFYLIRRQFKF